MKYYLLLFTTALVLIVGITQSWAVGPMQRLAGGGGQEGHGGSDLESHFYLRVGEVADHFGNVRSGDLTQVNWERFREVGTHIRIVPISTLRPQCLHQDGTRTARDACYYRASPGSPAHVDVYEGFMLLPPDRQRRIVAHEIFRAIELDASDESYELSNLVYTGMPFNVAAPQLTSPTRSVMGLFSPGIYSTHLNNCGLRVFQVPTENGSRGSFLSFVKIDRSRGEACLGQDATFELRCDASVCRIEFEVSRPISTCYERTETGRCVVSGIQYVRDVHRYILIPLEDGTFNSMLTVQAHGEAEAQLTNNRLYRRIP